MYSTTMNTMHSAIPSDVKNRCMKEKRKKAAKPHTVYIVKDGDSMHTISQKYGIRLKNLSQTYIR